jgi:NAD+ synthase (glutamine-hydrolysing)
MLKIVLSQLNYVIGDLEGNVVKMRDHVARARKDQADLIVFSELALCGYTPKDKLNYHSFIDRCEAALEDLKQEATDGLAILVGAPVRSDLPKGKPLYNSAVFMSGGEIKRVVHKTLLPTYDVFDEYRYFEPSRKNEIIEYKGHRLAVTICEDLWNLEEPFLYERNPMDELVAQKPDLMINLSGSPYSYNHVEDRKQRMVQNAVHYSLPLVYVNQVGANTEILFDGGSMFINRDGDIAEELNYFEEDYRVVNWDSSSTYEDKSVDKKDYDIEMIHDALVMGIKDYFNKMGFKKAVLGSSGGVDSALVHALAAEALGAEHVTAILMPSKFSSDHSVDDAVQLAKNLGSPFEIIPIKKGVTAMDETMEPHFNGMAVDVTEENIQARLRGLILMAWSNKFGAILLNTSNKSETAVGYSTLYGDMCGGFSSIGDLYKTQVYEMCDFINRNAEVIPNHILTKAPSAELRPDQKDSDSLPPYSVLDKILEHYIEEQKGWKEILALGFEEETVRKVVKLVDRTEYKRFQGSPILRISHRAFGLGRQMPLVARYWN